MTRFNSHRFKLRAVFIVLVSVVGLAAFLYMGRAVLRAQTCLTRQQVAADSRCLYILSNKVYQKGSRSNPHHGHACGSDITSAIASVPFHTNNPAMYLDPNFIASVCPAVTNTPTPTRTPTPLPPTPTPTNIPTGTPTPTPTPKIGDLNNDGFVDGLDMMILLSSYKTSDMKSDLNLDFIVNIIDFNILIRNYGI